MHTLRLTQHSIGTDRYRVEIVLEGGEFKKTAQAEFSFSLSPQEQESIRWYLEDYPLYRFDPAPTIAERTEKQMADIGRDLFRQAFQSDDDARDLWAVLRNHLPDTRVEIVTEVRAAAAVPWELIRDPKTDVPLALGTGAFVHANFNPAQSFQMPNTGSGPIRILLVICRPDGKDDVPFRSVASKLIKGLSDADRDLFQLDVLRPATFHSLSEKLQQAKSEKKTYHVVHFDGHGIYDDIIARYSNLPPTKKRGFLLFEKISKSETFEYIPGDILGKTLSENEVPVLVLNACRSAHAEAPEKPKENADTQTHRDQIRAFGSLAQEIVNAGTAGVVAMRYNVYVDTAARFVADLYASLIAGNPLGYAVSQGRRFLAANPVREISGDAIAMQDWCVPVVYEAKPLSLFPKTPEKKALKISLSPTRSMPSRGHQAHIDPDLPPAPDAGFWGRDETLLAMDRAFDTDKTVLLHAFAGSGKTAAVAEFARWYSLTGGVQGPVLFTSFEHYLPLPRVLDKFGQVFGPMLEQSGINWLALDDADRKSVALQVFQQIPVLWIWDNVEPVSGFPTGADSAWKPEEQKDLADFLRQAADTKAKFLLTSRREEKQWLRDFPRLITLPPMPMHEQEQMARALAQKQGKSFHDLKAWRHLLRFTDGNPLTLTVLVGQALKHGLETEEQLKTFTEKLQKGEAAFEDDEEQGRSKSLAASLSYGFEHAFNEEERKILALLYFFQGFVDEKALRLMGDPNYHYALPELRGMTRESLEILLNRAAEVGLLTAHGGGYYSIHPALPWFFKSFFDRFYPNTPSSFSPSPILGEGRGDGRVTERSRSERAFVEAVGELGEFYLRQYVNGNHDVIRILSKEEPNLLHARRMARAKGWWMPVLKTMQGLRSLYNQTGRRSEWKQLVEEIVPDFVNPATDGPLPGREDQWSLVTEYRVRLAQEERHWADAERLQTVCVEWDRKQAAPFLQPPPGKLDSTGRNTVRTMVVSLHQLGQIQCEMSSKACIRSYEESLRFSAMIGEQKGSATCAFSLGHAYIVIPAIRNLEKAEQWYTRNLELLDERDRKGRALTLGQIGIVNIERFTEARENNKPENELLEHFNNALLYSQKALEMTPNNAVDDLSVRHNMLGNIYGYAGAIEQAISHYNQAIHYREMQGNYYAAGQTRYNISVTLMQSGRIPDALDYARSALRNFETYGNRAADKIELAKGLIARLEAVGGVG